MDTLVVRILASVVMEADILTSKRNPDLWVPKTVHTFNCPRNLQYCTALSNHFVPETEYSKGLTYKPETSELVKNPKIFTLHLQKTLTWLEICNIIRSLIKRFFCIPNFLKRNFALLSLPHVQYNTRTNPTNVFCSEHVFLRFWCHRKQYFCKQLNFSCVFG